MLSSLCVLVLYERVCVCLFELCNGRGERVLVSALLCLLWFNHCVLTYHRSSCLTLCTLPSSPTRPAGPRFSRLMEGSYMNKKRRTGMTITVPSTLPSSGMLWCVSSEWAASVVANARLCTPHFVINLFIARWPWLVGLPSPRCCLRVPKLAECVRAGVLLLSGGGPGWGTRLENLLWGTVTQLCHCFFKGN